MKVVILNSKSGEDDLFRYGSKLLTEIRSKYNVSMYNNVKADFSNIPELFDNDEKILMFNHFSFDNGFKSLSKNLPSFKNIKYILSPYSSYAGLDLELLKKLGIKYRNNAGANAKSVAQYAITCMFNLLSRLPELSKLKTMPDGDTYLGEEFHSKTAGIIGMGNVGQELLDILNNLKIKTSYYNRTKKDVKAEYSNYSSIFKQDIVFITIATNDDTRKLLSDIHKKLRPSNYLIDVSAYDDLYNKKEVVKLLNNDKLKGYALETDSIFKSSKNFIATAHIAWCTVDAERRTVIRYLERAKKILEGREDKIDFIV